MRLVMPWFLPIGVSVAWLGFRTSLEIWNKGESSRVQAYWLVILMAFPLLCWLLNQFIAP
jgi:hypothetical protein